MPLTVESLGGFAGGVIDGASPLAVPKGAVRRARNAVARGVGQLVTRPGIVQVAELLDDQGTPAPCTTVCAIVPFGDGALLVGHSSVTHKAYLYTADASLASVTRVGVLWPACADAPIVWIAEGLGTAYLAHHEAASASALVFKTRTWDGATLADLTADLDGDASAETLYCAGCVSFQQHCVTWGFDQGTTAATGYRPGWVRISGIEFGPFHDVSRFAGEVGHRVRSARERIVAACVSGQVCYLAMPFGLWALTGVDRDTWSFVALDGTTGVVAPRAMIDVRGVCYFWSARGPMRVSGLAQPEFLGDAIPELLASVSNAQQIVAAYDRVTDQVQFYLGTAAASGAVRRVAAYDVQRDLWLGPDSDSHIPVFCANSVDPVVVATASAPGPAGPPTGLAGTVGSVSLLPGGVQATALAWTWTPGETASDAVTEIEQSWDGHPAWTHWEAPAAMASFGQTFTAATGGTLTTRVRHRRNGQVSAWDTASVALPPYDPGAPGLPATLAPPTALALADLANEYAEYEATWTNAVPTALTEAWAVDQSASAPDPSAYYLLDTRPPGNAEYITSTSGAGRYWVKLRHNNGSAVSPFTTPVSVDVTLVP